MEQRDRFDRHPRENGRPCRSHPRDGSVRRSVIFLAAFDWRRGEHPRCRALWPRRRSREKTDAGYNREMQPASQ